MIRKGGRRDIFLGTRECQGYIEPCNYEEEKKQSEYFDRGEIDLGIMFHGFNYPDETGRDMLGVRFWHPKLKNGIIRFCSPAVCPEEMQQDIRPMKRKIFGGKYQTFTGLAEESLIQEWQDIEAEGGVLYGLDAETE